jgi:protein-S-isoprenylcysteine O-methyltransferase Ste14
MELFPTLGLGWLNGWIPLGGLVLLEVLLLAVSSRGVRGRLFDRSRWNRRQAAWTAAGKLFSLVCLGLLLFTPLKVGDGVFVAGTAVYILGLIGLAAAILSFRSTPAGQPVTGGLYAVSRHPQIVMLFVSFLGMSLMVGSWPALLALLMSRLLQHAGILAEEEACLEQYGPAYQEYMSQVPRYLLFF